MGNGVENWIREMRGVWEMGNNADILPIDREPQGRDEGLSHHRTRWKGGS